MGPLQEVVLFEPIDKVKLKRAIWQDTSFVDFWPYVRGFERFKRYELRLLTYLFEVHFNG